MSNESPAKRKIEAEEVTSVQLKRTKSTTQEDLKESIVKEITNIFEDRISKLEARIKKLEDELLIDDEELKEEEEENRKTRRN